MQESHECLVAERAFAHHRLKGAAIYATAQDGSGTPLLAGPGYNSTMADFHYTRPNTLRILVADDDDVDRERIRRLLLRSQLNCHVLESGSGRETLALLQGAEVDCVILDYHLGDMTGIDLLSRFESDGIEAPVIMITGLGDERLVVESMHLGSYDYLPKTSLSHEGLEQAIETTLQRAARRHCLVNMQKKLERLSLFDDLTGLPNRTLFFDRLNQAILNAARDNSQFALLMMDLNLFKEVNDNFGHEAGDQVLAAMGDRYRAMSRKSDTIARLGGDEFTCILYGVESVGGAVSYAEKLVAKVGEPLAVKESMVQIGVSIGIVLYPRHGSDASVLLSNADHAMYQAKRSLRDYVVYSERSHKQVSTLVPVSNYLYKAIDEEELHLVYQPKINLLSGEVVGTEALLRWQSPELGEVRPAQFIPFAERSTLIEKLTSATIRMALDQLLDWRRQGIGQMPVAVNLSARMLDDAGLPQRIGRELEKRSLSPDSLILEITETALASSNERAKHVLSALAETGIGLSIDDFGSGFTSFKYMRDIDISEIKIDRPFVSNLAQQTRDISIVRSIASLSETMDVRVVAEGIETQESWSMLTELGCRHGQGFGIGYPMGADQFTQWFRAAPGNGFN